MSNCHNVGNHMSQLNYEVVHFIFLLSLSLGQSPDFHHTKIQVRQEKLDVVASFCYLGDMLPAVGSCDMAVTSHLSYKTWPRGYKKI